MPKIRFYHLKTLLLTYFWWTVPNLWFAYVCCDIAKRSLIWMPYYWAFIHILPLYGLIRTLWECDVQGFTFFIPGVFAAFAVVAGLLIKGWWALFFIIIGMSIWFSSAFFVLGLSA